VRSGAARARLAALAASLLAWTVATAGARPAETPHLFWIGTADHGALQQLAGGPAPPVRILRDYALAWGPAGARETMEAQGFPVIDLGERRAGHRTAVLYYEPAGGPALPEGLARILWRDAGTAIVELGAGREPELAEHAWILPVLDRPIYFASPRAPRVPPVELDPAVRAFVESVDVDSLSADCQHLQDFGTRHSLNPQCFAAGEWIAGRFRARGLEDVSFFDFNGWADDVVAVQPGGTAPDEIYVICGHYDSIPQGSVAPGADDNASGTSAVLEAARLFGREMFEATIIYVAFSGEEQGLVGSEAWAAWARDQDLDIRGVINLDMIGYRAASDHGDLDVISEPSLSWGLRDLAVQVGALYLPDFPVVDGYLSGGNSDQQSFWDHGYPALLFHEASTYRNPYRHTVNDRIGPSVNDFAFLRKNVQVAVGTLATLARPLRVRIAHVPVADPPSDAIAYELEAEILANAPLWTDSLRVFYRIDGGVQRDVPLVAVSGAPGRFTAELPGQPAGTRIEYYLSARDIEGRSARDPYDAPAHVHGFVVGLASRFADPFDEDLGWTIGSAEDGATSGLWERVVPSGNASQPLADAAGDSAGVCYVTGNGGAVGENDVDGGRTSLTSPPVDLAGTVGVRLSYARWFVDETFTDDTLRVYLSNDDGQTWQLLEAVSESARAWRRVRFDALERTLAPTDRMRLRFAAGDEGSASLVEAAVDEVEWKAAVPAPLPPVLSARSRVVAAGPVPGRDQVTVIYDLLDDSPVAVTVHDVTGRQIAELQRGAPGIGRHPLVWDGRDRHGVRAAAGIYFVRLAVRGESVDRRTLVLVR
jgi:hypothetical protein